MLIDNRFCRFFLELVLILQKPWHSWQSRHCCKVMHYISDSHYLCRAGHPKITDLYPNKHNVGPASQTVSFTTIQCTRFVLLITDYNRNSLSFYLLIEKHVTGSDRCKGVKIKFNIQGSHWSWKSWEVPEFKKKNSGLESPGFLLKVLESPGILNSVKRDYKIVCY